MSNKTENNNSVKIIADPILLAMGTILWFTLTFGTIAMSVWVYRGYALVSSDQDTLLVSVMYLFMGLTMTLVSFFCLPKWLVIIKFDKQGITYRCAYKKPLNYDYYQFGYVYKAYYKHFFRKIDYVVLSQIKLDDYQLSHINGISSNNKLLKIRIGKNKELLNNILPPKYVAQLNRQGW